MTTFGQTGRAGLAVVLLLAMTGCDVTDTTAQATAYTPASTGGSRLSAISPRAVSLAPFTMERGVGVLPGRIGERTTIGNVSMGYVTLSPPPETMVTEAVRAELRAAGHSTSGGGSRVSGVVRKFALSTPATALYWDVTIDAAIEVNVNGTRRSYADLCVERTYVWPSDTLIAGLARECIGRMMSKFRDDRGAANAL